MHGEMASAPANRSFEEERAKRVIADRYARSRELYARAQRVIPGGIHLSGRPLVDPETTPMYFESARGCRIRDVDGHQYIDYLMAFGANLLGYAHPDVERAAFEQATRGRLLSMNHPLHIELIETLVARFPGAELGTFFRTGSEATTAALRVARRHTQRRRVARSGYHGWHDWCLPLEDFVPEGLGEQVPEFRADDPATLQALFDAAPNTIAAVIVAPEMVVPFDAAVFHELLRVTHQNGAVFIMDEVKTGLRIAPGSISARAGIVPDLLAVSKALGNGFAIAALVGTREVMSSADGMHYSATFHGDTACMAAALETLRLIDSLDVQDHVDQLGSHLIDGLNAIAKELGTPALAYGEPLPAMPFMRFTHEDPELNARATRTFFREMLAAGVLLHPRHMWFISAAHTRDDIAQTLQAARSAFRVVNAQLRRA